MNKMPRLTACLASLLCFAPLWAQQDLVDDGDETELRRYTVEVIIFRYAEDVAAVGELFLPDQPEPVPEEEVPEFTDMVPPDEPESAPDEDLLPVPDREFVLLREDEFQLGEAYGRLERLDAYDPVMHFGWTQAALERDHTEAIPLYRFDRPPEDLDGTLTLYLGRYLHLVVDLQLRKADADPPAQAASGFDRFNAMPPELAPPTYYRIQESRIMKNGELRYFDHPKFGVLARVSRVEEEEPPEDGELLGYPIQ
jgi:hypothetical protein